jgi:hypothetical protein
MNILIQYKKLVYAATAVALILQPMSSADAMRNEEQEEFQGPISRLPNILGIEIFKHLKDKNQAKLGNKCFYEWAWKGTESYAFNPSLPEQVLNEEAIPSIVSKNKQMNSPIEIIHFNRWNGSINGEWQDIFPQLTNAGLSHLVAGIPDLTSLRIWKCERITNEGLKHLTQLKKLTALEIDHCEKITDKSLENLAEIKDLTHLSLRNCAQITDTGLQYLTLLKKLNVLNLQHCIDITNEGLQHLVPLENLTHLQLVTGSEGFKYLTQLKNLAYLELDNAKREDELTDELKQLTQLERLTHLSLKSYTKITDKNIEHLTEMKGLTFLNLEYCGFIRDCSYFPLTNMRGLTGYNIWNCYVRLNDNCSLPIHKSERRDKSY